MLSIPVRISQLSSAVMPFNSHSSSVPEIYPCFFAFSGILPVLENDLVDHPGDFISGHVIDLDSYVYSMIF